MVWRSRVRLEWDSIEKFHEILPGERDFGCFEGKERVKLSLIGGMADFGWLLFVRLLGFTFKGGGFGT